MKKAFSGLTTRGRSFLAAGAATIVCAVLLGERDLLRLGVLILVLPLLSALAVARTRYRLSCTRRLRPTRVPVEREARVDVRFENLSRLPTGLLLVEDQVPYALGSRPRFVLNRIEPRGVRQLGYRVRSDLRGRFRLGPLTVRMADPFGMVELSRSFTVSDTLVVTPTVETLPEVTLAGDWSGGGERRSRTIAVAGEDDIAPREYRHGDDLRRVHWRSTARHGELMVRREEQRWQTRGVLFLDTRARAHRGAGPTSSFERAVSATASIGTRLAHDGLALRLITDCGPLPADTLSFEDLLLDSLAVTTPSRNASLAPAAGMLWESGGGLVVAVLGALDHEEAQLIARARRGNAPAVAVLLQVSAWSRRTGPATTRSPEEGTAHILAEAGWRVLPLAPGTPLASVWSGAGRALDASGIPAEGRRP